MIYNIVLHIAISIVEAIREIFGIVRSDVERYRRQYALCA